jgi:hypothetical protein
MQYSSQGSTSKSRHPELAFDGVKVFSATLFQQRAQLGEVVTEWIAANPTKRLAEIVVTQSSDASFHCFTITVFYSSAPQN